MGEDWEDNVTHFIFHSLNFQCVVFNSIHLRTKTSKKTSLKQKKVMQKN
jgi:hypothetical protein